MGKAAVPTQQGSGKFHPEVPWERWALENHDHTSYVSTQHCLLCMFYKSQTNDKRGKSICPTTHIILFFISKWKSHVLMQECLPFAQRKREEGHNYVFPSCRKLLLNRHLFLQRLQRAGSWREPGLRGHVRPPPGPCVLSLTPSVTAAVGDTEMDKMPPRPPR